MDFVDKDYKPSKNDLIAEFKLRPSYGRSFEDAASNVAKESSVGTWTNLSTMKEGIEDIKARVFELDEDNEVVKIAYPSELFELDNIPQVMSSIAGNIFGMKLIDK
ncbi:MAG: ribulose-bisphosphate carboxylase large subunit, partial [Candidatus Aenigmatarchaeota archaeon]